MIHSFLIIGQSNMAGRGFAEEALPVDFTGISMLRNGRWQPIFRPINPDRPTAGVNLAESFAEAYAQKYQVPVGIIPAADGGTKLEQWVPGSLLFDLRQKRAGKPRPLRFQCENLPSPKVQKNQPELLH